jgi:hypothetical protein
MHCEKAIAGWKAKLPILWEMGLPTKTGRLSGPHYVAH